MQDERRAAGHRRGRTSARDGPDGHGGGVEPDCLCLSADTDSHVSAIVQLVVQSGFA